MGEKVAQPGIDEETMPFYDGNHKDDHVKDIGHNFEVPRLMAQDEY